MKKYDKYNILLNNYYLTDLMIVKRGKRKGLGGNSSVYMMLSEFLRPYGVHLWGNWSGLPGNILLGCYLDKRFPAENFPILKQMYGWSNAEIYICLDRNSDCEYGFYFNDSDDTIKLVEYRLGSIVKSAVFKSFAEFWDKRKEVKLKYDKLF